MTKNRQKQFNKGQYTYYFKAGNKSVCKRTTIIAGSHGVTIEHIEMLHDDDKTVSSDNSKHKSHRANEYDKDQEIAQLFGRGKRYQSQQSPIESMLIKRIDDAILKETYQNALQTLSQVELDVITYMYYKRLSQDEIAEILGRNQSNVSRLHQKIIKKLKVYFNSHGVFGY